MPASARADLIGDEEDPFEMTRVTMQFRPKERHVGLRDEAGRLVAATGTVMSEVTVGRRSFPVAGIGGVIVVAAQRGRGLGRRVVEEALARAGSSRAEHAM